MYYEKSKRKNFILLYAVTNKSNFIKKKLQILLLFFFMSIFLGTHPFLLPCTSYLKQYKFFLDTY